MRILFIAQGDSPHTVRTLRLTKTHYPDAVIDVFRSTPANYSPWLQAVAACHENGSAMPPVMDMYWNQLFLQPTTPYSAKPHLLAELLRRETFDFIHVLCMQEGAYLLRKALEEPNASAKGAKIVFSLWGNDLYYFARVAGHFEEIQKALAICDRLHADADRDTHLAKSLGFQGEILPTVSGITAADTLQKDVDICVPAITPPSQRKKIFVRGSYTVRGRTFLALPAFQTLPPSLKQKYELILVNATPIDIGAVYNVTGAAAIMATTAWVDFGAVLKFLSESRVVISLNTTDGTPQLFWEACATHCYPIFSRDTGLMPHLRRPDGMANFLLVNPDDIREIAQALEEALTDDAMVDAAGPQNHATLHRVQSKERLAELFRETYRPT